MADVADRLKAALADRYALDRELGRGGMATVYIASDLKHHRQVAVKVLHPDLAAALGPQRFLGEIEIAARLTHPHILPLLDSGAADGFLYYVMPYIEGESVRTRLIREGELPIADAIRILRDVADALADAHVHGVVHRDIKPDNVLLRGQHAVVTDFGVAKAVSEATGRQALTTAGLALGTPAYMAPEQAAADPHTDHRADIYALGVLAYETLTGRLPFVAPTPQAMLAAQVTQAPEPVTQHRPAVPAPLAELVMRCLAKKPADRWQRADEILHQLEAMYTPGTGTTPTALSPTVPKPTRLSRTRIGLVVGAALLVVALGWGVLSRGWFRPAAKPGAKTPVLAVLPFENLGAAEDEYFADGMTEELTSRLARLSGLAVIARTSVMQYKGTKKAIQQVGQELGADYLIEGSVRWEKGVPGASRVRITPQLIRAKDGTHVWAEPYEEPYGTGIFKIQSEIAERVTGALSVTLLAGERKAVQAVPTRNLQAYDYFLRGRAYSAKDVSQNWEAERVALEMYTKAVELDPGFALAHAWVASTHLFMNAGGYDLSLPTGVTAAQRLEMVRAAANRALAIDPDVPQGHAALAFYYGSVQDTARQRAELDGVLRAQPSDAEAFSLRGQALLGRSQMREALESFERATTLDPRNAPLLGTVAGGLFFAGQYQSAEAYLDRMIGVSPDGPLGYSFKAWIYLVQGRLDDARAVMREGVRQAGGTNLLFTTSKSSVLIRLLRTLREEYSSSMRSLSWDTYGADSVDYYLVKAIAYWEDGPRARAYSDSLVRWARPRVERGGEDLPFYHLQLATGLAGSGRREAATAEINKLLGDPRYNWSWTLLRVMAAEACVMAGLYDRALDQIELAMADPQRLNPFLLKVDPEATPRRPPALPEGRLGENWARPFG